MDERTMGDLIAFPSGIKVEQEEPLTCFDCAWLYMGSYGMYCGFFREEFADETQAQGCDGYSSLVTIEGAEG